MSNKNDNMQEMNTKADAPKKAKIGLPIIALVMDFATFLFYYLPWIHDALSFLALFSLFSPIIGMITGIVAISLGKKEIGTGGMIISILAVSIPVVFVLGVILLSYTGVIVLSM